MNEKIILSLVFVFCLISSTNACNCTRSPIEDKLCNSDFVMRVHIRSDFKRIDSVYGYYRIRIRNIYKFNNGCEQAFVSNHLYSSCQCNPNFSSHEDYLITGRVKEGYLGWCDGCDFFKHFNHLTKEELYYLEFPNHYCHRDYPKTFVNYTQSDTFKLKVENSSLLSISDTI